MSSQPTDLELDAGDIRVVELGMIERALNLGVPWSRIAETLRLPDRWAAKRRHKQLIRELKLELASRSMNQPR